MNANTLGKLYAWALSAYFILSGLSALLDIDSKLSRIGLRAETDDGRIAFILIYCSLMVGVGSAMAVVQKVSKSWLYSALIAVVVTSSFILFRILGAILIGHVTQVQVTFVLIELVEVLLGTCLILLSRRAATARD